jgi:hydrogenase maturation protease
MEIATERDTLVIGVGNEFRGDDGAGRYVARSLARMAIPRLTVREHSGEGASLMEAWKGFSRIILVDATSCHASPGTICRLDAHDGPIPSEFFHYSTHAFSLAEAVALARAVGALPPRLLVYGIEGKSFTLGQGLSDEVRRAADEVVYRILREITGSSVAAARPLVSTGQR